MSVQPSIESLDADEKQLSKIRRSPVPLIILYFGVFFGLAFLAVAMFLMLPGASQNLTKNQINTYIAVTIGALAILAIVGLELYTFIYRGNYLILTDKKFTQVLRKGLFNRNVAELSLADVEDVTAVKSGVFATIFDYGTLRVETAGELENFDFKYCPRPNFYGKIVLDARQQFLDNGDGDTHA